MLRFIKHHLATEDGVMYYGLFSLLVFVIFFLVVFYRMVRMKKETIEELSNIPFGQEETNIQNEH